MCGDANSQPIWICSAWEPEQRVLRSLWDERMIPALDELEQDARERCLRLASPEAITPPEFIILGVGAFSALESMTREFLHRQAPKTVFFVATAGATQGAVRDLGDVFCPTQVMWEDWSVESGQTYLPAVMSRELRYDLVPSKDATLQAHKLCRSAFGITQILPSEDAAGIAENLELYSCVRACSQRSIAVAAYLGISNWIGPNAHDEWRAFGLAASCAAQIELYAALGGGSSSK